MNKLIVIILIVIAVCVLLLAGFAAGVIFKNPENSIMPLNSKIESALGGLSSNLIDSISGFGEVTAIEGKNITIGKSGKSLKIEVKEEALIFSRVADTEKSGSMPKVDLKDLKIGDKISVSIKIMPDGALSTDSILIMQSAPSK